MVKRGKDKRLFTICKAFNRYFLTLKVKNAFLSLSVITCAGCYYSRDLYLSLALGSLGIVLMWLFSGFLCGRTGIPISYAGEDADSRSIWQRGEFATVFGIAAVICRRDYKC